MEQDKKPLVSIIMCTYNRADYILETIDSIQKQTYTNWELLIMDNGSKDNTEELVISIQDKKIQYYKYEPGFTGTLRNIGFKKSVGELIALMDSDDIWPSEKMEKQVDALLRYPQAGCSLTNGYNFRGNFNLENTHLKRLEGEVCQNIFVSFFQSETSIFIQSVIFKRECLKMCGEFDETRLFNDAKFLGNLTYNYDAVVLYEPLLFRRLHEKNHSSSNWKILSGDFIEALYYFKNEKKLPKKVAYQSLFVICINAGETCLKHNQVIYAFKYFLNAWKNKPLSIVPLKKMAKASLSIIGVSK